MQLVFRNFPTVKGFFIPDKSHKGASTVSGEIINKRTETCEWCCAEPVYYDILTRTESEQLHSRSEVIYLPSFCDLSEKQNYIFHKYYKLLHNALRFMMNIVHS